MFEYLPLKAGELTGRLSFSSSELGVYQYDLNLTATPAGTEAPVHFRAGLGTSQSQTCRFVNFAKSKVEYSCKVIQAACKAGCYSFKIKQELTICLKNVLHGTSAHLKRFSLRFFKFLVCNPC